MDFLLRKEYNERKKRKDESKKTISRKEQRKVIKI